VSRRGSSWIALLDSVPAKIAVLCFAFAPAARADYAVLRSGQRLHITGWQNLGETVRLDVPGGSVTVGVGELAAVEPEDLFPPNERPSGPTLDVPYAAQIKAAASTYGVDPKLVASVIAVESNFNARAVSHKYALGLMQLMPETAARLAVKNVFDPAENIDAGTRYLKELLQRYGQKLELVLAAYNAGPERVEQYGGVPPYQETRDYVRRVIARFRAQESTANTLSPLSDLSRALSQ